MIGALVKIGDRVKIYIEKENREWGYNPCDDGPIRFFLTLFQGPARVS